MNWLLNCFKRKKKEKAFDTETNIIRKDRLRPKIVLKDKRVNTKEVLSRQSNQNPIYKEQNNDTKRNNISNR